MLHMASISGVAIFGAVVWAITRDRLVYELNFQDPVSIAAGVLSVGAIGTASVLDKLFFANTGTGMDVNNALQKYQTFFLIRTATIESAALFSAVVTLMKHNATPGLIYLVGVCALLFYRPSPREFTDLTGTRTGEIG